MTKKRAKSRTASAFRPKPVQAQNWDKFDLKVSQALWAILKRQEPCPNLAQQPTRDSWWATFQFFLFDFLNQLFFRKSLGFLYFLGIIFREYFIVGGSFLL